MTRPDLLAIANEERSDLAHLLRSLEPSQWLTESLCPGWRVRDVAIHVVSYDDLSPVATAACFARGRFRLSLINQVVLDRYAHLSTEQIVDLVDRHLRPRGVTALRGGGIALTDATIHHQDIRRVVGAPRRLSPARVIPALEFALRAPALPAKRNTVGLQLVATDADWMHGSGLPVEGPLEALLMATAGRGQALDDLTGPGVDILSVRLGS